MEGNEIAAPEKPKRARVVDLMDALQKSLAERPLAKAEARKAPARKRPRAGRHKAA
jgi:non-homologous end joining protein Ku